MPAGRFPKPIVMRSGIKAAVSWARWGVAEEAAEHNFEYDEVRPLTLTERMPWVGDCSWWCKWVCWRAGWKVDPTGANWGGWGNSSSIFAHNRHVSLRAARPGDIATFGPGGDKHAAFVVAADVASILCSSMGEEGDPSLVTVAAMLAGIPDAQGIVTICRPNSAARHPVYAP